ncbi:hypothetical protein UR08_07385 [Listeria kieliensis]|uniref:ArnR1-like winged helix-turn-helix domain-containing protein n=1 Tax=Listeria kieliensis TaxID=1621700 RepID=A0A3D8TSQ7_9LIST|nr:hypothetical protein UR08_07385 [Listeria kieliensis]
MREDGKICALDLMRYLKNHGSFVLNISLPNELKIYSHKQVNEILETLFHYHLLFKIYGKRGLEKYSLTNRGKYVMNKIDSRI